MTQRHTVTNGLDPWIHDRVSADSTSWIAGSKPGNDGLQMRSRVAAKTLTLILVLTLLAACGKKGSPIPPGPSNEIVYPRAYPAR